MIDLTQAAEAAAAENGTAPSGGPAPRQEPEVPPPFVESVAQFLDEADPLQQVIFPELLPCGVTLLLHGDPRARKSLVALELALAAATGTAPFGLARFSPPEPVPTLYVQEEDPRALTRRRLRALVQARCGDARPPRLHVAVRRGVNLDDPQWVARLIEELTRLEVRLLALDPARRLSAKTDEGPQKVREITGTLRRIVTEAGVTIVIVHHDVKPLRGEDDARRRGHRASGGDWFAACECPVHVERVNESESLVYPQDYKFSADPAPFTLRCVIRDGLVVQLVGTDSTTDDAETAGARGRLLDWLRTHGPAAKTTLKKAGFGWASLTPLLESLMRAGLVDATPGRAKNATLYFVVGSAPHEPSGTVT
jgi:hypothetical protein